MEGAFGRAVETGTNLGQAQVAQFAGSVKSDGVPTLRQH